MVEKKKKPKFVRQGYGIKKSLGDEWRRPKGHQSKMRRKMKGHRKMPSKGYRNPRELRGMVNGEKVFTVRNVEELRNLNDGVQVIISSTLGTKKLSEIVKIAKEKKIKILNREKLKKLWNRIKELKARKKEKPKEEKQEQKPEEDTKDKKSEATENAS